ncbi:hypothetical protein [Mucilaginibacter ginsenosidivorans]|uniref:Uncharacterized protein n=1 Tax=Mucilaginibacter ginsenosidivorans TaxID=398053 RepID=A0A5B8UXF5_9SPHI|nr:hypothetical protein [Mucilaginibacter ginsenosidivorans]QEC63076.1 hypothetical protein FRZ54_10970 [Mucilaginibacter ginsenosidivorans]
MDRFEKIIDVIKQQAEAFLLDAGEFYPFGTSIRQDNKMTPIGAYIEANENRPESQPLIDLLHRSITKEIEIGNYTVGALAYEILMNKNDKKFDAMAVRIYESDKFVERYFKYDIQEDHVKFLEVES